MSWLVSRVAVGRLTNSIKKKSQVRRPSTTSGDEKRLVKWIDKGPMAVIELAKKYLPADNKDKLSEVF